MLGKELRRSLYGLAAKLRPSMRSLGVWVTSRRGSLGPEELDNSRQAPHDTQVSWRSALIAEIVLSKLNESVDELLL